MMKQERREPVDSQSPKTSTVSKSTGAVLLEMFVYILGAIVAGALLAGIVYRIANREKTTKAEEKEKIWKNIEQPLLEEVESKEQCIAKDDYLRGCRAILAEALELLCKKKFFSSTMALTNYEILRRLPPKFRGKDDLYQIARVIEKGYYASCPIEEEDYLRCLKNLEAIQNRN